MITKEQILSRTSTYNILCHFLAPYYDGMPIRPGIHVYVPEISGKQKSPSFNIYHSRKSGEYRYKDFTGHDGSAFDLVMNLYNKSFTEALAIINKELRLNLETNQEVTYQKVTPKVAEPKVEVERDYRFDIEYSYWKKKHLQYWANYGSGIETLELFGWKPVKRLDFYNKRNEPVSIKDNGSSLIFAWERSGWGKYYMPEIKDKNGHIIQKKGFGYFGKKEEGYVFGLEQLPETGDDLYLIGGEKDVCNMRSHGMYAVCLTSEESSPKNYPKLMELIESNRFKNYLISYDNDICGRRQMTNIHNEIPKLQIKAFSIPDGQDISDYLKTTYEKLMY
jgi:hypothetical protein